jgi:hypothetical protein
VSQNEIPAAVQKFILDHVNSVEQLETLLLLQRFPSSEFTVLDVSRSLYSAEDSIHRRMEDLRAIGLVTCVDAAAKRYRYSPPSSEVAATVAGLAEAYQVRRVSVITMIFSKGTQNLRAFTDSFKFKKEDPQ